MSGPNAEFMDSLPKEQLEFWKLTSLKELRAETSWIPTEPAKARCFMRYAQWARSLETSEEQSLPLPEITELKENGFSRGFIASLLLLKSTYELVKEFHSALRKVKWNKEMAVLPVFDLLKTTGLSFLSEAVDVTLGLHERTESLKNAGEHFGKTLRTSEEFTCLSFNEKRHLLRKVLEIMEPICEALTKAWKGHCTKIENMAQINTAGCTIDLLEWQTLSPNANTSSDTLNNVCAM